MLPSLLLRMTLGSGAKKLVPKVDKVVKDMKYVKKELGKKELDPKTDEFRQMLGKYGK